MLCQLAASMKWNQHFLVGRPILRGYFNFRECSPAPSSTCYSAPSTGFGGLKIDENSEAVGQIMPIVNWMDIFVFVLHDGTMKKKGLWTKCFLIFCFGHYGKISLEQTTPCIHRQAFKWRTATKKHQVSRSCSLIMPPTTIVWWSPMHVQCSRPWVRSIISSWRRGVMGCWECFFNIPNIFPFKLDSATGFPGIPDFLVWPSWPLWNTTDTPWDDFLGDCFETTHSETNTVCDVKYIEILSLISLHVFSMLLNPSTCFSPPKNNLPSLRVLLSDGGDGSWANAFGTLGKLCGVLQILESEAWTPKGRFHWMPGIRKGLVVGWLIQKELKVEIENPDSKGHV